MSPSPEEIHRQLERVLASDSFANAERLSRFLRYVVDRACAGEAAKLKEFVIGTEVYDRDHHYDPRLDSVVRVEAGRLRAKLAEYYGRAGADDSIIIRVPRGGYVPTFDLRRDATAEASAATVAETQSEGLLRKPLRVPRMALVWAGLGLLLMLAALTSVLGGRDARHAESLQDVRVAVFPLSTYSNDESLELLAARVTDGVTRELARLRTVQVVSHLSALQAAAERKSLPEVARALRADVIVTARLAREGDSIRVEAVLIDAASDRKFWVSDFNGSMSDLAGLQRQVAVAVAAAVGARAAE